jgi:hypothetical protein
VKATIALTLAWLLGAAVAFAASTLSERPRDILFTNPAPGCKGGVFTCGTELHFNGDWTGVKLCRAQQCVAFEEVFSASR